MSPHGSTDKGTNKMETEKASKGNLIQLDQPEAKYQVGKQIGKGTYGVVYEGVRLSSGRCVAIKFVSSFPSSKQCCLGGLY